jgi:WD40 repeat protein
VRFLSGHTDEVWSVTFSPDGQGRDLRGHEAHLRGEGRRDLESGESRVLAGHTKEVVSVTFSPDGRVVVTASADGTVRRFWDDLPSEPGALRAWIEGAPANR